MKTGALDFDKSFAALNEFDWSAIETDLVLSSLVKRLAVFNMADRPRKGRVVAPGQVVGRQLQSIHQTSPRRKQGSKGKRAAPQEDTRGGKFHDQPIAPTQLNYNARPFVPSGSVGQATGSATSLPSPANSGITSLPRSYSDIAKSKGVKVDESRNVTRQMPPPTDDEDSLWEEFNSDDDSVQVPKQPDSSAVEQPNQPATDHQSTDESGSSGSSSDEEEEGQDMYTDLAPYSTRIWFKLDGKLNFWWAVYDKL